MAAISRVAARSADDAQDAQKMAVLLAKTVQASIDMGNSTDLSRAGVNDDSVRVALAGLAAPLVAEQYSAGNKIPDDAALKRMITALQAVMTFSENFTPSPENTERLKSLAAAGLPVDIHQIHVQYIQAFIPVVNVIGVFSFGQSEQKLIMEIAGRLVAKAVELREALAQNLSEEDQKLTELALLRALAPLYAACHEAETERLTSANAEERGNLSMDNLWRSFEIRVAMMETLAKNLLPGKAGSAASSAKAPAPPPAAFVQPPPASPPPQAAPPAATPPPIFKPPAAQAEQAAPPPANPMSLFAKPKTDEAATAQAPSQAAPPPASPPPAASPAQQSSPMSFFKAPAKNDGEG